MAKSTGYGQKAQALGNADKWDRENSDIKNLINEIADIIDPKGLHWTVRLGRVMGSNVPSGQLASFLGKSTVAALWPMVEGPPDPGAD